eukprot:gene9520-10507_t
MEQMDDGFKDGGENDLFPEASSMSGFSAVSASSKGSRMTRRLNLDIPTTALSRCVKQFELDIDHTGENVRLRHDAVPKRFKKCPLKKQIKQQQSETSCKLIDHAYTISVSPRGLKKKLVQSERTVTKLRHQLKIASQRTRRMKRREIQDDSSPVAKDALVFMVVNINGSWKVPCAYFLIDGLSGAERANLVSLCIQRLSAVGVKVVSLTYDGPSCHFSMLSVLGASLKLPNLNPSFPHPSNKSKKVHVLLDVCHMLKLVRNTLANSEVLMDKDDKQI